MAQIFQYLIALSHYCLLGRMNIVDLLHAFCDSTHQNGPVGYLGQMFFYFLWLFNYLNFGVNVLEIRHCVINISSYGKFIDDVITEQ